MLIKFAHLLVKLITLLQLLAHWYSSCSMQERAGMIYIAPQLLLWLPSLLLLLLLTVSWILLAFPSKDHQ